MFPMRDVSCVELSNAVSKAFSGLERKFYVGATCDPDKRLKEHSNPFGTPHMTVVYETKDLSECRSYETFLIHYLTIDGTNPVNDKSSSVGLRDNFRCYYVYILVPDYPSLPDSFFKKVSTDCGTFPLVECLDSDVTMNHLVTAAKTVVSDSASCSPLRSLLAGLEDETRSLEHLTSDILKELNSESMLVLSIVMQDAESRQIKELLRWCICATLAVSAGRTSCKKLVNKYNQEHGVNPCLCRDKEVLRFTGKISKRAPYISDRARSVDGMTFDEVTTMQYSLGDGTFINYKRNDIWYDIQHGYLTLCQKDLSTMIDPCTVE